MDTSISKAVDAASNVIIDDVQDQIDTIVLSVFQTMLAQSSVTTDDSTNADQQSTNIVQAFQRCSTAINQLSGIDRSKEEQEDFLKQTNEEIIKTQSNVMKLEKELLALQETADKKLDQVTHYD